MRQRTVLQEGCKRGFKRGSQLIPIGSYQGFLEELGKANGWSKFQVHHYMSGRTICQPLQVKNVEDVFARFNISPSSIWDEVS